MHITINVHCETAAEAQAVVTWLGRMPSAELPVRVPPREPGDDEPVRPTSPPPAPPPPKPKAAAKAMTGGQLLGWIGEQPDARAALRKVQDAGKKLGYGWQVRMWKPDQVARVFGQLGGAT